MMPADSISARAKIKDDSKKLTKVLSTKLSAEDYDRFEKYTNNPDMIIRKEDKDSIC